ncbi:hypothetical protein RsTz2092_01070 [Deferribacterales bacterium RsTz2092]|nr:hypothetical protein AGMMS49941_04600 [Deferribacterales bacterium]
MYEDLNKDVNEVNTVARQINEGKYSLINAAINPNSDFFTIAKDFTESVRELASADSKDFTANVSSFADSSKLAQDIAYALTRQIVMSGQATKNALDNIDSANEEQLRQVLTETIAGGEQCAKLAEALEKKQTTDGNLHKLLSLLDGLEEQLAELVITIGLKRGLLSDEYIDSLVNRREVLARKDVVQNIFGTQGDVNNTASVSINNTAGMTNTVVDAGAE